MARRRSSAVSKPATITARRAVAYLRVSALMGRGGDDFHSPDMQLMSIRGRMTAENLTEVDIIDDDIDQTGRTFDREGIAKIKRLVEGGHIDAVVFYDIKRFGRNVIEGLTFARWLDQHGVRLVSASENLDTSTPSGRLMFTQLLAFAEYQSDEIGQYWAGVHRRRALNGLATAAPMGYHKVNKRHEPHPVMGPGMREVFRRYARGERLAEISRALYAETGTNVRGYHLKRNLANQFYRGYLVVDGELVKGQHKRLIDERTWQRVQSRLEREKGMAPHTKAGTWALTGLVFCPDGHAVHVHAAGTNGRRLICGQQRALGRERGCLGIGQPQSKPVMRALLRDIEAYTLDLALDRVAQSEAMTRHATADSTAAALRAQLAKVQAAMTRLTTSLALDDTPEAVYRASMAELRAAEKLAADALREAEAASSVRSPLETVSLAQALLDDWPDMTETERNRALGGLIKRVTIRRRIRPREPVADCITVEWL